MVKLYKGDSVITVPNTTKNIYLVMGYQELDKEEILEDVQSEEIEDTEEIEEYEDYTDKPIAQWSKAELGEFVKDHEIDLGEATKISEVRAVVKEYLEQA